MAGSRESFLCTEVILAIFHSDDKRAVSNDRLKREQMLGVISLLQVLRRRAGISSGPLAFVMSSALR